MPKSAIVMNEVVSSNIHSAGYDAEKKVLHIKFHGSNQTYAYEGVPKTKYEGIFTAHSAGSYVHDHIVSNKAYKTRKLK